MGSELAYTVGYEHGQVATDGNRQPVRIRAIHIYRREQDEWRLVHRHGDLAPVDEFPWPCCIWSVRGMLKRRC